MNNQDKLDLTTLQERLVANILSLKPGDARSDVLGRAVGVGPGQVSASLLALRALGYISSGNDGGQYNFWCATPKLRAALHARAVDQRALEQQRRLDALCEASRQRTAQTKARLLAERTARQQRADMAAQFRQREARSVDKPTCTMTPVTDALHQAMRDKGFDPIAKPKYIVWSPSASMPPKVQYATHDEALRVAGIMAERFPRQAFIVCELQSVALYTPPVQQPGQLVRGTL